MRHLFDKAGTGKSSWLQSGVGGLNEYHGNGPGRQVLTNGTVLPDEDIITHSSSTNAIKF
jgi:hypothetical protein